MPKQKAGRQSNTKILVLLSPVCFCSNVVANAVARIDNLEFLSDIIPRTMTYKRAVARRDQVLNSPDSPEHNGSLALDRKKSRSSGGGRESAAGRGGIERFFGGKPRNGVAEDEVSVQDERMDIDD